MKEATKMDIDVKINCKNFSFSVKEIQEFLELICKKPVRYRQESCDILEKLNKGENLTDYDKDILRAIYFLHNEEVKDSMVKEGLWKVIGCRCEAEKRKEELKNRAQSFGKYRYEKDKGWLGVYAEDKVKEYFRNMDISFKPWSERKEEFKNWTDSINGYDIKVGNLTIDVKCATEPHYVEITPKVNVENEKPKDVYIATKFFDDGCLYLIGYFLHKEITKYPQTQKYGAKYYQVKLYDARCINDLLEKLKNQDEA